jgi:murein DD-endopeptidase MepM/ murein hydrolase activator NlpD
MLPQAEASAPVAVAAPIYGPDWPPTEAEWVADLAQDAWIHPLGGPERRMPKHHGRVFGAERPGDRPAECYSGHCGVDIGGEVWGEAILAVHDGTVDRVNRGPNEERGGVYVRIAHRQGTVFTQYFHLAAVPKWIKEGVEVQAGQVIGLLGDTGVHHSAPHLHFTISVKPSPDLPEQYIDPEPLIALWPVWMPEGMGQGRLSTMEPPGLPVRGSKRPGPKKKGKKEKRDTGESEAAMVQPAPAAEAAPPPSAPAPAPAPAPAVNW